MALFKSLLIFTIFLVTVSARTNSRYRYRRYRGRTVGDEATAETQVVIDDAISFAADIVEDLGTPETLTAPEAAQASQVLQEKIQDAIAATADQPQVQETHAEISALKVEDTHGDLTKYLRLAKRHQEALDNYGDSMSFEETIEHHKGLQKYLELAVHFAEQNQIAVQEEKAVEAGAAPVEVAEIAPAIIAGRAMGGKHKGRWDSTDYK